MGRTAAGDLYLYPGDGIGGWLPPSKIGQGWQVMDKIIPAGDINGDGPMEIYARDRSGHLFLYPANGQGGWNPPSHIGGGWGAFPEIIGMGSFGHSKYNDLSAINSNGNLVTYSSGASTATLRGPYGPIGTGWNVFRQLL